MKLLLDEMYSRAVAEQLRDRGRDVIAVTEHPDRRGAEDPDIFAWAQEQDRALVTDDIAGYVPIHAWYVAEGRAHRGLIFTANRRFPRAQPNTLGTLVEALDRFLRDPALALEKSPGFVHWLQ